MRAWIEPLGWMLVHSVWLISLIVALAAVVLSLLRRRSANARYLVGGVALVLSVSVLPSVFVWVMAQSREVARPVVATDTTAAVKATDVIEWDGASQQVRVDADPDFTPQPVVSHLQSTTDNGPQATHTEVTTRDESTTRSAVDEPTTWQQIEARLRPHLTWLVSGWLAGVCLLSLRPLIGWHATWRLRRVGLSEVSDDVLVTLRRLAERLGLRRATKIFQSSLVRIPCVVGAFKPVILLPASVLTGLSPEQLEAVLAHELAHVRRHDFLVNALQTVAETLLFYHPAIWWLSRRIRQEREHCCDDLAISVSGDVAGYARMLVSIEGLRGRVPQTSVAAGGGSLVERIRRLLPTEPRHVRAPWQSAIVVLVTLGLLIGSWQGAAGQRKKTEEKPDKFAVTLPNGADGESKKFSATDAEVDAWVKELASDSAKRRVTAAAEIARRAAETKWLASDPAGSVDSRLIHELSESLGQDEMVMHGNRGQRVGAWCQDALKSLGVPTVSELIRVTREGNAKARGQAAECLGAIKKVGPNGVEALIELLKHPDYEAHGPASSALRQLTDEPTLIPKLIAACEQGELKPRCWAIGVLGRLPDERGDPVLLKALDAPERDLRLWAAYALSETPHPKLSLQIVSRIKTDDREIRQKLETALQRTAKSNVPALLAGLKDDDARVRAACVHALTHLLPDQASSVVPDLKAVLNDDDTTVRRNVFYLMQLNGRLFDADSFIGPLLKGLSDSDADIRTSAASAFQRFAEAWPTDRRPIEPLLKALDDSEPDVVINAIRALAEFRERTAVARLTQLAKAGGKTGEAASQALGVLGDPTSREILRQNLAKKQPGAIEALGKLRDRESIPQFIELLNDGDESVRTAAAAALALNPDPRSIEPLIASLRLGVLGSGQGLRADRNNSTRAIADTLGRSGDPRAIAALIERIDDANRQAHFTPLGSAPQNYSIGLDYFASSHPFAWPLFHAGLPALPELAKGLASPSSNTRQVCAWVLDNLASQGDLEPADFDGIRPELLASLRNDDPVVRFCVVKTVGELELPEAEPILLELLESPLPKAKVSETTKKSRRPIDLSPAAQIQVEVIRSLSSLKTERTREALLRALQHSEPAVRSAAAGHLGGFPAAVTVEPLIKALSDPGACAEAARVLGHVGDQRAIAPLIELLKSNTNPTAQANAALALGLLGATDAKPALREVLNRIPVVDAKSEQFQTQSAAAVSLAQLHDEAGTARLKELLGSSDYETRSNVASRLGTANYFSEWRPPAALSHEPTREVMRYFAEHAPDTPTRLQLFNALGGQLDQTTREFLERRARDPKETLRWAAWRVLIRPNPAANEEQLLELLDQHKSNDKENNYPRREIASFLGQVPTERATDRLLALTSDADDEVRLATVIALSKHRSPKVDARLRELSTIDPSLQVRARALKVLAVKSDKPAVKPNEGAVKDGDQPPAMMERSRIALVNDVEIQAEEAGQLGFLKVAVGKKVKQGDVLTVVYKSGGGSKEIVTPFPGEVVKVFVRDNEPIKPSQVLLRLVQFERVAIEGELDFGGRSPRELIGKIEAVQVDQDTFAIQRDVTFIDPKADANGKHRIRVEVENRQKDGKWLLVPGRLTKLTLLKGDDRRIRAEREALGTFRGSVSIDGVRSKLPPLDLTGRQFTMGLREVPDESLLIGEKGGIANVIVYLPKAPPNWTPTPPPTEPLLIECINGRFSPRASILRVGQKLKLKNSMIVNVNFHSHPLRGIPFNMLGPPNAEFEADLRSPQSENLPYRVLNDIHPWMQSWIMALDHPFVALTNAEGRFEVAGLPPGNYEFRLWHERGGYLERKLPVRVTSGQAAEVSLKYKYEGDKLKGTPLPVPVPVRQLDPEIAAFRAERLKDNDRDAVLERVPADAPKTDTDAQANATKPKRSPNPLVTVLQPAPEKALLDANGEVMPLGMAQRFGSTRFKVPGWWRRFGFAGNDEWIWIKADERVSVIHRETGRVVKHHQLRLGEGSVRALGISPDGTQVAIGMFQLPNDADGQTNYRVVVMSALTTAHLQELKWKGQPSELSCLSFSGDGKVLLTGTQRGDVRLWDVETGRQLRQQAFEEGADLRDAALSSDGGSAVLGGWGMSFLWKIADNAGPIKLAKNRGDSVSFAPNGRVFATINSTGVRLWNGETGELVALLLSSEVSYRDADFGIAFTPDSRILAVPVVSKDLIELWDVETKQRVATLPTHQPRGAAISRDGRWLAAAGQDSFAAIFDLKTRQQVNPPGDGHSQEILSVRFAGANSLVSSSAGDARVWDMKTGKQQQKLAHEKSTTTVRGLATSPDGTLIVTSAFDDTLGLWDRATGKRLFTLKGHGQYGGSRAVRFKSDGSQFASWGDDAVLRWWNAKDGSLFAAHPLEVPGYTYDANGNNAFRLFGLCAAFAPDTKSLFVVFEQTLSEFDTQTGKRLRQAPIPPRTKPLAVSADGRWIAAGESRRDEQGNTTSTAIVLRDRATLKVVREWPVSDPREATAAADPDRKPSVSYIAENDNGMAFSPDSRFLAWSRIDAHPGIDIVKIEHDGLHASIPVESPVWCLDFAANGADLASGHADSTINVWNRWHPAFTNRPIPREGRWVPANRTVSVKVVDAKTSAPLEGVSINAIRWEGMRQHEVEASAITNAKGIAEFKGFDAMVYRLDLTATKPLPYSRPGFHSIGEMGNEAVIKLERACELTLKAVDSETGRGIPGVTFGRERALAEYWLQDISPDTLALAKGVAPPASRTGTPARRDEETGRSLRLTEPHSYMTDADGVYRCLVDEATWSYSVMEFPPGYDRIVPIKGRHELELETPVGGRVEYTFKLVKTAKAVPK